MRISDWSSDVCSADLWMGQALGWRWGFGIVAVLAMITMTLVALYAPRDAGDPAAVPMRELGALREPQVLLTLLTGAIGFGGLFAVYTYVASTMISVTHVSERSEEHKSDLQTIK